MKTYILPGMGADHRMYAHPAYRKLPDVEFIDWPRYQGEKSVAHMAQRVINQYRISANHNMGGTSFGGMVASEIARQIPVQKLILISSTNTPQRVNNILRSLSNFSDHAPVKLLQLLMGKVPFAATDGLLQMFAEADPHFMKAMSRAIFTWAGNSTPDCEVFAIHGMNDKVIKPPPAGPVTLLQGGHLITLTHAKKVSSFLEKVLNKPSS